DIAIDYIVENQGIASELRITAVFTLSGASGVSGASRTPGAPDEPDEPGTPGAFETPEEPDMPGEPDIELCELLGELPMVVHLRELVPETAAPETAAVLITGPVSEEAMPEEAGGQEGGTGTGTDAWIRVLLWIGGVAGVLLFLYLALHVRRYLIITLRHRRRRSLRRGR
ncbi:MAG: hypothetical protein FWE59_07160, partial [Oscillospiraceae bacterium]|nr:hypothetical protein [Oscillospiraceae bacterium]